MLHVERLGASTCPKPPRLGLVKRPAVGKVPARAWEARAMSFQAGDIRR